MSQTKATSNQVPQRSILDRFDLQAYLGQQFKLAVSANYTNIAETPIYLISNPSLVNSAFPNGRGLFILSRRLSCLTSGASAIFRYYDSPLITSTGIETPVINSRLSSTNSSVAAIYGPGQFSVSSNGTYRSTLISTTQDEAENCSITIIDPGYTVLITCQMSVGTGITCASELIWNEI